MKEPEAAWWAMFVMRHYSICDWTFWCRVYGMDPRKLLMGGR